MGQIDKTSECQNSAKQHNWPRCQKPSGVDLWHSEKGDTVVCLRAEETDAQQ